MNLGEARRQARAELADHAASLAASYERTADANARDKVGAADARRMATAHRAEASRLDPASYPPPRRPVAPPPGMSSLISPDGLTIEELTA